MIVTNPEELKIYIEPDANSEVLCVMPPLSTLLTCAIGKEWIGVCTEFGAEGYCLKRNVLPR